MKITLEFDEKKYPKSIGLAIIFKYESDTEFHCEHDEMWAGDYEVTYNKMTKKEKEIMEKTGWSEDEDSWHVFA